MGGFRLRAGLLRDIGLKRATNQDFVSYFEPMSVEDLQQSGCIYIVADGVGGAIRGELASEYAVKSLLHRYYQNQNLKPSERLAQIIPAIGNEIYMYAQQQGGNQKMATTIVVAIILGTRLIVANVGDSRAYLIRGGTAHQITRDHRQGENRLTRSVGGELNVKVDLFEMNLQPGDRILLCSDGLYRYFNNSEIAQWTTEGEPFVVVHRMIEEANQRGGADNISVVVIDVGEVVDWQEIPQTHHDINTPLPVEERATIADPSYWGEEDQAPDNPSNARRNRQNQVVYLVLIIGVISVFCFLVAFGMTSGLISKVKATSTISPDESASSIHSVTPGYLPAMSQSTNTPFAPIGQQGGVLQPSESLRGKCQVKIENIQANDSFTSFVGKYGQDRIDEVKVHLSDKGPIDLCGGFIAKEHCGKTFQEIIDFDPKDDFRGLDSFAIVIIIPNVLKETCESNNGIWIGTQ